MKRATKPPRPPVVHADDVEAEPIIEEELEEDDLETHRPPAPTVPFVPTPMVEWPPTRTPTFEDRHPSSHSMPTAPKQARPPSERSMEAALRQQMWTGLASPPTQTAQTGPHIPVPLQQRAYAPAPPAPTSSSSVISSPGSSISGPYATISEQRDFTGQRTGTRARAVDEGWPLGYVVASAFFLAIAAVGFGLWLAFEVISL